MEQLFHSLTYAWFSQRFGDSTEVQEAAWPLIARDEHTLIAAPTGSGKTLAAFLWRIDQLVVRGLAGELDDAIDTVYVSPLKALSNDIQRNLETPLHEIEALARSEGIDLPTIRAVVRTGDTPSSVRQAMSRRPPHILVTTPESLYLLLTSPKSRHILSTVRAVVVDEIHALARDKRGSHLSLSLERLDALCETPPVRIGLSATQRPIERIAQFLVGTKNLGLAASPLCHIIDGGHVRELDLAIETPPSELTAVCTHEQWAEIYALLAKEIHAHRSTLVFVNTRRLAERVAHHLREELGEDCVASHHGSLSRDTRLDAEERLRDGSLRAMVATSSLEMGIDVGFIDLVCQIGSPRSIAAFLQRVGRSGHSLGRIPQGRLYPLSRDELIECMALIRAVREGELDEIEIPDAPLDILAQQLVATVANEEWSEFDLFELVRGAWPYRDLDSQRLDAVLALLHEGAVPGRTELPGAGPGGLIRRDRIGQRVAGRRSSTLLATTCGGAIPESADYRVIVADEGTCVGTVNEDFAVESIAGDIFLLGNTSWRIQHIRAGEVTVVDAHGAPATVPFWYGEAPGRTVELSLEVSKLRQDIADRLASAHSDAHSDAHSADEETLPHALVEWLVAECCTSENGARQAAGYVGAQLAALGLVPTQRRIVIERFLDDTGGTQIVVHAPFGARINRAWGLALRKRFCSTFHSELQASADDDGIVLSMGPQHGFPLEHMFQFVHSEHAAAILVQALLAAPLFTTRWRWNATRALAVTRFQRGKKVPPPLQRMRADDLLAAVFPQQAACLDHITGEIEVPDHPLVVQTVHDCLHEAMDVERWLGVLEAIEAGDIEAIACDTREPSPFSYELLNANPYAFLDSAPLAERRARAVATRRTLSAAELSDLARLDPAVVEEIRRETWPLVRDADELHDALLSIVGLPASEVEPGWTEFFDELVAAGRATIATTSCSDARQAQKEEGRRGTTRRHCVAAEAWPLFAAAYGVAVAEPQLELPECVRRDYDRHDGCTALVRGRLHLRGILTAAEIARDLGLPLEAVRASLESLESEGFALRGHWIETGDEGTDARDATTQWCERRLLARMVRRTLDGLRREIEPASPEEFLRFLCRHAHVHPDYRVEGIEGLWAILDQLAGVQAPAGAWEIEILPLRVAAYDSTWLDELTRDGEAAWARLLPPERSTTPAPKDGKAARRQGPTSLTRAVPIALFPRADRDSLAAPHRDVLDDHDVGDLGGATRAVLEALERGGGYFADDLVTATGLLTAQVEAALGELAARGLASCDSFAAIRSLVSGSRRSGRGRSQRRAQRARPASGPRRRPGAGLGRWSLVARAEEVDSRGRLEFWAWLLLRRYGVVFRDLMRREPLAPRWGQLAELYRRLEVRGEIRGGRFVRGVGGEQFALEDAIGLLRRVRSEPADADEWIISAADPLNLTGVVGDGPRIAANLNGTLAFRGGRLVAWRQGENEGFDDGLDATDRNRLADALARDATTRQRLASAAEADEEE